MKQTKVRQIPKWLDPPKWLVFSLLFVAFAFIAYQKIDPDFGWHLKAGEYFINHGIPATDIFTFTAGNFPWVDHEWLSDIFLSGVYHVGGYPLLAVVYGALWTMAFWLVGRKKLGVVVLLAALAAMPFAGVRTVVWSILGLALLMTLMNAKDRRWRLIIPLLILAWTNMHGSFVVGLAYIAWRAILDKSWKLGVILIVSTAVTFINPYGIHIYTEVFRTLFDRDLHSRISEWKAFAFPAAVLPFVVVWAVTFLMTSVKKWRSYIQFDLLTLLASLSSQRNWPLFTLSGITTVDERLHAVVKMIPLKLNRASKAILLIMGIFMLLLTSYGIYKLATKPWRDSNYPVNAVAYLQQHDCTGNLFNEYDYGGFLIWRLPDEKVFIDGRMPSWELNGHKYMDEYLEILDSPTKRAQAFIDYDIGCVIVNKSRKGVIQWLDEHGWQLVADDTRSELYVRNDIHR